MPDRVVRSRLLAGALLSCALLVATPGPASGEPVAPARSVTALDARSLTALDAGWRFERGESGGAETAAFDDSAWAAVTLPHTYNGGDGDDGGTYYRGPGWYRRTLMLARVPSGRRMWLQFDGAALATDVWVNGRRIGRHEGGHAGFRFDVTDALRAGRNTIAVRTDNSKLSAIAPLGGDFTVFGGLYRHVWLIEVPDAHIDLADHGGPGVYVTTRTLEAARAELEVRVLVRNDGAAARRIPVALDVRDATGTVVATAGRAVRIAAGATATATLALRITDPHRWQGRRDPYLYRVTAQVAGADAVTIPIGLRTATFDPRRGFLLNGESYPLHGVNLFHSGRPGRGLAVTDREIADDMETLDALGVTGVRLVHFQHPQAAYDEADRRGFAIWTEIGLNGVIDPGAPFAANISEQMRELIRQNYNHPSVVMWGLGNEVYATTPDVTRTLRTVQAVARAQDPTRPTVYAHCCQADDNEKAQVADLGAFNRYFGWYPGQKGSIGDWADTYHARYSDRAFAVGEYGAGASIRHQQLPAPVENMPESGWHPEQAQTRYHVENWRELASRPYLWGNFVWVAFDLASDGRHEGDRPGINDKGLVTYDRAVRKDAYYWYQANWSATPMVHLTDRRLDRRGDATIAVRAFTNANAATLTVNGRNVGTVQAEGHVVAWPAVPLTMGDNAIEVVAGTARDAMRLTRVAPSAAGATDVPVMVHAVPPATPGTKPPGQ